MGKKAFPRNGAWAVIDGKVGLLYLDVQRNRKTGEVEHVRQFHEVDAKGETARMVDHSWNGARIATQAEIPASRIVGVPKETLAALGYL